MLLRRAIGVASGAGGVGFPHGANNARDNNARANNALPFRRRPRTWRPNSYHGDEPGVYVIGSTTNDGDFFACHQNDTTYVLCFDTLLHADAISYSLETYHVRHGAFPNRDATLDGMNLGTPMFDIDRRRVTVRHVPLTDLLLRVRGTGIVLSILARTDVDGTFVWKDVWGDNTPAAVRDALNGAWALERAFDSDSDSDSDSSDSGSGSGSDSEKRGGRKPGLLPRPAWPPKPTAGPPTSFSLPSFWEFLAFALHLVFYRPGRVM